MNVIVSNKYQDLFSVLNVDVIKRIDGEFTVDEIIQSFSNFFFNRMFLDITAIKDYKNIQNIQKLSISLDVNKIIFFLENDESSSAGYLSKLISMGIYNFTTNKDGLMYLYDHPNSYKDVAHIHQIDQAATAITNHVNNMNGYSNTNVNVQAVNVDGNELVERRTNYILGIRNITYHAGATSLIYMLKKELSKIFSVIAIEVNKRDFVYFNDNEMISCDSANLEETIMKHQDVDIILLDMNDFADDSFCSDALYLIEPSTLKLNKMIMINRTIFNKLSDKKIVLNKSLLSSKDVMDFEYESRSKVFYNLPPMNDKVDNSRILLPFLDKLGLVRTEEQVDEKPKKFSLFKF